MGTVWADTALFGQPLLVISARLYSQSMVAHTHTQTPHGHEARVSLSARVFLSLRFTCQVQIGARSFPPHEHLE